MKGIPILILIMSLLITSITGCGCKCPPSLTGPRMDETCPGDAFERPRFFEGQILTAEDLEAEQSYFPDKRRLDNRLRNGWGVICGLEVTSTPGGA